MNFELVPFLEVFRDASGGNKKSLQKDILDQGQIPVVDQGQSLVAGYVNDRSRACNAPPPVIVFGDHTRCFKYVDFEFAMGADGTKILVPKVESNMKFLYYALKALNIPSAGYSRHYKFLKEARIPLPPLDEQKRIARILDAADALRAKRRESLAQLDTLLQSTFLDMFGDPVTNPMGWDVVPLAEVCNIITGFAFPSGEFLPKHAGHALCRGVNVGIGTINWRERVDWTEEQSSEMERFRLAVNDIVLAMDRPWISTGLKIAIVKEADLPALLVQRVSRIRCPDDATLALVYALINSPKFEHHCSPTETTIPHISPKDIKGFPIIQPPIDSQRRFEAIVRSVEQQKIRQRAHLDELDTLFASLQQRAFNGELSS